MDPGTIVAERFIIERAAGMGSMGAIYLAKDRSSGERVALKLLLKDSRGISERFLREARLLSELQHPAIVRYVAHGADRDGAKYLAMEWLEGIELEVRLSQAPLTMSESVRLIARIADALAIAHARGIVHRDLKPANIFLPGGRLDEAKLLDFGIAHMGAAGHAMTATGMLLGTPGYMAPEQARGGDDVDPRADVFALGCILFECITGRYAFEGEHMTALLAKILVSQPPRLSELRDDVPEDLDELVARMLAKERDKRPRDGAALVADIAALAPIHETDGPRSVPPPAITVGERRLLSIVLVDARRFDVIVERTVRRDTLRTEPAEHPSAQPPADLSEALREAAAPFGARVEQLADGSIVAVMGSTGAATDQAVQAARCALAMRAAAPDPPMALATGRGEMQSPTAADAIDRAAALLRHADESDTETVLVDDVTASLLESRFLLAGNTSPRRLLGEREGEEGRRFLGKQTTIVGRDRELAALEAMLAECVGEPVARAVLVTGAAGVGKSRVRHEFVIRTRAKHPDIEVWIARGDSSSAGAPFSLLRQLVRVAFGLQDGEPAADRREKVRARIERDADPSDRDRLIEFFGEVVGTPVSQPSVQLAAARHDAVLMGDQLRRAWEDFVRAISAKHPLVLVLEDMHWGDLPTVRFVDAALRVATDSALFVLAVARPEVHDLFPKLWAGRALQTVSLGELPRKACERLVYQVLGKDADMAIVARIVERADGNAFYLEELIRAVAQGRGDELPETVLAMVQARLEALDADTRRLLRAASVFGQVFWFGGVRALLGGERASTRGLEGWIADLQNSEIVIARARSRFPGEREFVFRHAPLRDAAYAMLTPTDRALGHRLAAEWLEQAGETSAPVLAEHFDRAGDHERAVRFYLRAAELALEGNDYRTAVERSRKGIESGASGELLARLQIVSADAERLVGAIETSEEHARAAIALVPVGSHRWFDAARLVLHTAGACGHADTVVALSEQLLTVPVADPPNSVHAISLLIASSELVRMGRRDLARTMSVFAHDVAARLGKRDLTVFGRVERVRAFERGTEGDMQGMLEHQMRAIEAFEAVGDLRAAALVRPDIGYACMELGLYDEAVQSLRRALDEARSFGLTSAVAIAQHNLGMALGRLGQLEEAEKVEWDALRSLSGTGNRRMDGGTRLYLAEILLLAGKLEGAEREARTALEMLSVHAPLVGYAHTQLAKVLLARGAKIEALEQSTRAMACMEHGVEAGEALIRVVHAEALIANGRREEARPVLAVAKEQIESRAAAITNPSYRLKFLTGVPEHARVLELAW